MKKKLLLAFATVLAVFAVPASTLALDIPAYTSVSGIVKQGSAPVDGASVTVNCDGPGGTVTESYTTEADGSYAVAFAIAECPADAPVHVLAQKGGAAGSKTVPAGNIQKTKAVNITIADVEVALPEMSTIVGGATALAVGGGLILMRRKQLGQN